MKTIDQTGKVSIILPTYNSGIFLERAVNSVLVQTYTDWRLIIVDDKSTDNTIEIIEEYSKRDPRIKGVYLKENSGGPAHPRNVGIREAKGEYIAFLDHDDEWLPDKLKKQLGFLQLNKNIDFLGCDSYIDIEGEKRGYKTYKTPRYSNWFGEILKGNFIHSCSSVVIKKTVFNKVGLFDEKLKWSDDWDLYLRILRYNLFDFIPEELFIWHSQKDSQGKKVPYIEKANEHRYFLEKHGADLLKNLSVYSKQLRHLGSFYVLGGNKKIGRKYFLVSINYDCKNFQSYLNLLLSFLGSEFYQTMLKLRKKISKLPLDQT